MIKCVIWDIDNTLLDGVYLESPEQPPPPDPELLAVLRELAGRGILHALASRNPPEAAAYVREVTGMHFAAAECGWDSKADAVGRIAAALGLAPDAMAFVDDDMIERAEVAAALPDVLVLTPEDAAEAPGWPRLQPAGHHGRGQPPRRRCTPPGSGVRPRPRRSAAAATSSCGRPAPGSRSAGPARPTCPRLRELSVRTHQLNSGGAAAGRGRPGRADRRARAAGGHRQTARQTTATTASSAPR